MFPSPAARSRLVLAAAAVALFAGAAPALGPWIPPDAKGFRSQQIRDAARLAAAAVAQHDAALPAPPRAAARGTADATPPLQVTVRIPAVAAPTVSIDTTPAVVAIRGPNGEVRRFNVEGGQEALQSRVIVVHPGERATVQFVTARR